MVQLRELLGVEVEATMAISVVAGEEGEAGVVEDPGRTRVEEEGVSKVILVGDSGASLICKKIVIFLPRPVKYTDGCL